MHASQRCRVYVADDHPVYEKLGVSDRAAAVAAALRSELLE